MTTRHLCGGACLACLVHAAVVPTHGGSHPTRTAIQQDRYATGLDAPSARVGNIGRYVAFSSFAGLVPSDRHRGRDVYVLDTVTGDVTLESAPVGGRVPDGESFTPDISGDGRVVVFASGASTLVRPQPREGIVHVYERDRVTDTTILLTTTCAGVPATSGSLDPVVSADGSTVAFASSAPDLCPPPETAAAGNVMDVYAVRPGTGERLRVSVASDGTTRAGQSTSPAISADGRHVAFMSRADLTSPPDAADRNGLADVYLRDTVARTTLRISRSTHGMDGNGASYHPSISDDGRFVAFASEATNLVHGVGTRTAQVYVHDTHTGVTELVTRGPDGRPANNTSLRPQLSATGTIVVFQSLASDLLCASRCRPLEEDINLVWDAYLHDRASGRTLRVTADGEDGWMEGGRAPSTDHDGVIVVFTSRHPRDDADVGEDEDVFIRRVRP